MTKTKKSTKKAGSVKPEPGSMALWLALPFGLIMPSALPPDIAAGLPEGTIQVRARDPRHLQALSDQYLPELGEIIITPDMDYQCRAYCTKTELAEALAAIALDVDSAKFKPQTFGPRGLKDPKAADALPECYNRMWSAAYSLGPAKPWAGSAVAEPDPQASSEVCQREGHL